MKLSCLSLLAPSLVAAAPLSRSDLLPGTGSISTSLSGKVQNVIFDRRQLQGRDLQDDASCSKAPFLWMIQKSNNPIQAIISDSNSTEISTVETVGFAIGTMHFPKESVLSDTAWQSLKDVTEDSCAVYGEIDATDPQIIDELTDCMLENQPGLFHPTLDNIPDKELRNQYKAILLNIAQEYAPQAATEMAEIFYEWPIDAILLMVAAYNTPEYKDAYFVPIFDGGGSSFLDLDLLELGRPSGNLESTETQCGLLKLLSRDQTDFARNYETIGGPELEERIDASYSPLVQAYKCGTVEGVLGELKDEFPSEIRVALLDDRNVQMADRMIEILQTTTQLPVFAVGLAHWIVGDSNLENLLMKEGYTLQRVDGIYDPELLPEISNAKCSSSGGGARFFQNIGVFTVTGGVTIFLSALFV